jgi:hypothetical protein
MRTHDPLNWQNSGGVVGVMQRRLRYFTIEAHPTNGRFLVKDDRTGQLVGAGFASVEDAQKAYAAEDFRRVWNAAYGDQY